MSAMLTAERWVVRATDAPEGRTRSLAPGTTAARQLHHLYVPRDSDVEVTPGAEGCDLAEIAAGVASEPELAVVVRESDVVIVPEGYHPNVSAPGRRINFLWMMAAHREGIDRQFGVVNVQPEYAASGSGIEKGR
jgi:hypothetical protein